MFETKFPHPGCRLRRKDDLGFSGEAAALQAHVKTGLRPRLDQAAILQQEVSLQRGRHTDLLLAADAAHGGNALTGPQSASVDQLRDLGGNLLVTILDHIFNHEETLLQGFHSEKTQFLSNRA